MFDPELEKRIEEYFEAQKDNIINDIFRLVQIPSISLAGGPPEAPFGRECVRVMDEALKMAEEKGFTTHNFDYYVGTARWGNQESDFGLCTHIDVVPEGNDWIYEPYPTKPQIVQGHLVGRGVSDDKGPAVLMMYVKKCIEDLGIPMRHGIRLIMGCNEECGMADLEYYKHCEKAPRFTLVPDSIYPVNNGEKGRGKIKLKSAPVPGSLKYAYCGRRGNLVPDRAYATLSGLKAADLPGVPNEDISAEDCDEGVKLTAKGISCHSTKPETGRSPIKILLEYLLGENLLVGEQKKAAEGIVHILSDFNGAGLGIAYTDKESGSVTHIMDEMEFTDDVFSMVCATICPVTMDMDKMQLDLKKKMDTLGFEVEDVQISKPVYISTEDPIVQTLMEVYDHVHTRHFPPIVTGGTYAKMLPNALAYGNAFRESRSPFEAGHGGIHKPDECISIADLLESARIYVLALLKLDEVIVD